MQPVGSFIIIGQGNRKRAMAVQKNGVYLSLANRHAYVHVHVHVQGPQGMNQGTRVTRKSPITQTVISVSVGGPSQYTIEGSLWLG
jgi:hypothetical protein